MSFKMSYSAMKPIQACGDTLSPLTPKAQSPCMTTTGRARPSRLCFRRTLSCSSMMSDPKQNAGGPSSKCKLNKHAHGPLTKQPAINVISEESINMSEDVTFTIGHDKNVNHVCKHTMTNHTDNVGIKPPLEHKIPPKKTSEPKYSLPVISVTCEEQPSEQNTLCDKHSNVTISVEPPSPSRRAKSVPGVLLTGTCRYILKI